MQPNLFKEVAITLNTDKEEDFISLIKPAEDRLANGSIEEERFATAITLPLP